MPAADLRIGVDVGGTNTDAVVVDAAASVLATAKVATTSPPAEGIRSAIGAVLAGGSIETGRVTHVMVGTTTVVNTVLELEGLRKVAVLRIGAPATLAVRPLFTWPPAYRAAISVAETVVGGGIEFDGRDIVPLDLEAIARFCAEVAQRVDAVAITSVFSPISPDHELAAAATVRRELGPIDISMSHRIGSVGLIERENATVLNAAVLGVAETMADAVEASASSHGLGASVLFSQNDGTLMSIDYLRQFPVFTIGSGPANSILGAGALSGLPDAVVVDVGGTSTDVGMLTAGFPRQSSRGASIAGIRTNLRAPDLVTIALGGGSHVSSDAAGGVRLGPRSVGSRLLEESACFGGPTLTLTDAAVAAGRLHVGDRRRLADRAPLLEAAMLRADALFAAAVDGVKTSRAPVPLVAVGGASTFVPDGLPGVGDIVRPAYFEVANAVGAAIAKVGGQVDHIVHYGKRSRTDCIADISEEACRAAVAAGADPTSVEVVALEETPLAYLTSPAVRLHAKAVGNLKGA